MWTWDVSIPCVRFFGGTSPPPRPFRPGHLFARVLCTLTLAERNAERLIGSIRRECLDHIVVIGEQHLRHILMCYMEYYNAVRTHLSLGKDAPVRGLRGPPESGVIGKPVFSRAFSKEGTALRNPVLNRAIFWTAKTRLGLLTFIFTLGLPCALCGARLAYLNAEQV